jgi:hypothetical protein
MNNPKLKKNKKNSKKVLTNIQKYDIILLSRGQGHSASLFEEIVSTELSKKS